jgi:DNA-binding response OmpR family regulator
MPTSGPLILIVEDDANIATSVAERIAFEGWRAEVVSRGNLVLPLVQELGPDAIVLDIMLPGIDGFQVIKEVRKVSVVPIIMLTARTEDEDEIRALELGADDFLTKPLRPSQLIAHIKVWLKRYKAIKENLASVAGAEGAIIEIDNLRIDSAEHTVKVGNADEIYLTPTEFALLHMLAASPDRTLRREELLKKVWNWDDGGETRTVDSHVKVLRKKLGNNYIKTVHGVGYKFNLV